MIQTKKIKCNSKALEWWSVLPLSLIARVESVHMNYPSEAYVLLLGCTTEFNFPNTNITNSLNMK